MAPNQRRVFSKISCSQGIQARSQSQAPLIFHINRHQLSRPASGLDCFWTLTFGTQKGGGRIGRVGAGKSQTQAVPVLRG
jgi:hypothetical protein